jgi:hypothetical protein
MASENHLDPHNYSWGELRCHLIEVHGRPPKDLADTFARRRAADTLHEGLHEHEEKMGGEVSDAES